MSEEATVEKQVEEGVPLQETPKELTPREKINREYNELCNNYGHVIAQKLNLQDVEDDLKDKMVKLMKKAQNIAKDKE